MKYKKFAAGVKGSLEPFGIHVKMRRCHKKKIVKVWAKLGKLKSSVYRVRLSDIKGERLYPHTASQIISELWWMLYEPLRPIPAWKKKR